MRRYAEWCEMSRDIILIDFTIYVLDPETNKIILAETYDSKSALAEAILKDNE